MSPRRSVRSDEFSDSSEQLPSALTSETLRNASRPRIDTGKNGDEKVSLFWRIFGGTILSIVALIIITAYQSISGSVHDLRTDLAHLNEAKAEFVKKDEYSASRTRTWDRMAEIQKDLTNLSGPISLLKDRVSQIEEQTKAVNAERKDASELNATIKERLTQFEQQLVAVKTGQKDVQSLLQTITAMQEKANLRDQQIKQIEDDRKEMLKEVQSLRERLARVEATTEAQPANPSKTTSGPKAGKIAPHDPEGD